MSYKIAVLDDVVILPEEQQLISNFADTTLAFPTDKPSTEEVLILRTGNSEAVLVSPGVKITASYLDACPSVKYIGVCGTSTTNVDLLALSGRGIMMRNVIDYGDEPAAEFTFMQLAMLMRGTGKYKWRELPHELMGKSLAIVGLGALGQAVANLALAYKMRVSYYSQHRKPEWEKRGLRYGNLHDLLPECDVVVVCVATNTVVMGPAEFALLKKGAIFIQRSSGDTVERESFLAWIAQEDNFAIFDYAAGEQNYQAYKDLPRVIFANVHGGYTQESRKRLGQKTLKNLKSYFEK